MRQEPVYIVDIMAEVVTAVAASLAMPVYYMHGHPLEVCDRLTKMTSGAISQAKKYPLVALFQDFDEDRGTDGTIYTEAKLHMIIAAMTSPKYTAAERYTKNFKPVLYPVYDELLYQLMLHPDTLVTDARQIKHTKTDRLFWGKNGLFGNESNIFNDFIDCIEIQNLLLTIKNKQCSYGRFN